MAARLAGEGQAAATTTPARRGDVREVPSDRVALNTDPATAGLFD